MLNDTAIRWTSKTWNVFSGCQKVSAGCKHCYAETIATKWEGGKAFPNGFDFTWREHKLTDVSKLKEPQLIFVNSMSDLFWEKVFEFESKRWELRDRIVDVIEANPKHEFQVLTKRPELMLEYSKYRRLPSNLWAGVSVENQEFADKRLPVLLEVEAEIRWISLEPILGAVDLKPYVSGRDNSIGGNGISWVVFGGESGGHLKKPDVCESRGLVQLSGKRWLPREDRIDWARDVRDACVGNGVKFFFKQWGGTVPKSGGKLLDGVAWEEYPRLPIAVETKQMEVTNMGKAKNGSEAALKAWETKRANGYVHKPKKAGTVAVASSSNTDVDGLIEAALRKEFESKLPGLIAERRAAVLAAIKG